MDKHLHIICLEVPYPPDFGGMYDLFYKLPALQKQGVNIHLHCFQKDRGKQTELTKYCEEVFYYKRNTGHKGVDAKLPYIVASRNSEELLNKLLQNDYPIFMEGVHCTFLTTDIRFEHRKKFVRLHNVEQHYYKHLFNTSSGILNKIYYYREAALLKNYEKELIHKANAFWPVTVADTEFYRNNLNGRNIDYLSLFLPDWKIDSQTGMGTFCLYHGNLGVDENEFAATWLLKNVFDKLEIPFVIAGKNSSKKLERLANKKPHTCLVANPTENQMQDMIAKAHLHILPSFSQSGIKLKLLNALYHGRHCVVNDDMLSGTNFHPLCHVANTAESIAQMVSQLFNQPFTTDEILLRSSILYNEFNNETNAKKMITWIWGE